MPEGKKEYVGFGVRFVAAIIDAVVLMVAGAILGRMMPFLFRRPLISSLTGALYSVLMWVNWNGQTLGKKAMGIKVVREDGKPLDYGTAIIRYICYFVSTIPLLLGYLWIIWDEKKQGFHDKIARTLVVKE